MNPLLFIALVGSLAVILCWTGAQVMRWTMDRARRREAKRRGGLIDLSRRRL